MSSTVQAETVVEPVTVNVDRCVVGVHWTLRLGLAMALIFAGAQLSLLLAWVVGGLADLRVAFIPIGLGSALLFFAAVFALTQRAWTTRFVASVGVFVIAVASGFERALQVGSTPPGVCAPAGCAQSALYASPDDLTTSLSMFLVALFVVVGLVVQRRAERSRGGGIDHRGDPMTTAVLGFFAGGLIANVVAFPMPDGDIALLLPAPLFDVLRQLALIAIAVWTLILLLNGRVAPRTFTIVASIVTMVAILNLSRGCGWFSENVVDCVPRTGFPPLQALEAVGIALAGFLLSLRLAGGIAVSRQLRRSPGSASQGELPSH